MRNSNTVDRRVEVGDLVLLKKDFENNTETKRNSLEGFFYNSTFEVVEILRNNMIKVKDIESGETKNVYLRRLKKVNKQ